MARKMTIPTFALFIITLATGACQKEEEKFNGYVEGEYLRIAPSSGGILSSLAVARGDTVIGGQALFSLDLTQLTAARDAAAALKVQAAARLTDATKGKRSEEIEILEKQREQAMAALQDAENRLQRSMPLEQKGYATTAQLDADQARVNEADAKVAELEAALKAALLGSRDDVIAAAAAEADAAYHKLMQAERVLKEAAPLAPAAGVIEDVYYRPGEFITAGFPVVSLLPPENVKVRFFVPQRRLPAMQPGGAVNIHCDGCGAPVSGTIIFVSSRAEYTPPIIYSEESRDKLVFMVEAKPDEFNPVLRPGLPVDVDVKAP